MQTISRNIILFQVDDDSLFNAICRRHFKRNRFVELIQLTTINATELRLKRTPGIDVLVLDLSLPDRDGMEFLGTPPDIGFTGKLIIVSSQLRDVINLAGALAIAKDLDLIARIEKPLTPEKLATPDAAITED